MLNICTTNRAYLLANVYRMCIMFFLSVSALTETRTRASETFFNQERSERAQTLAFVRQTSGQGKTLCCLKQQHAYIIERCAFFLDVGN